MAPKYRKPSEDELDAEVRRRLKRILKDGRPHYICPTMAIGMIERPTSWALHEMGAEMIRCNVWQLKTVSIETGGNHD